MEYALFVDTDRLDEHVCRLSDERRLAALISEHIQEARRLSVDADIWRYYRLQESAEQLEQYFSRMAVAMGVICDEYNALHRTLSNLLDDARSISKS